MDHHEKDQGALERVRAARHRISERFGHDPEKLVAHYIEMQKKYSDRLVNASDEQAQQSKSGGT